MEKSQGLVDLCIEAATASSESVEKWRRQWRTVERLPSQLADALFRRLHSRRLLFPSILEVFQLSVEMVDLSGESCVDTEWMVYLGAFRCLHSLNIADCKNINNFALWHLSGHNNLKELDLSRCSRVTDDGIKHLLSISSLEKLCVSEIGLTVDGVLCLSSFVNLRVLDLGGIPVTDKALSSLRVLTRLEHLDLWGSEISNIGAATFEKFPLLSFLNIAWTKVTRLPFLSIACLNMSNCTIHSIFEGDKRATPTLSKLTVIGATFSHADQVFSGLQSDCLKFLDISYSNIGNFNFLVSLNNLEHLNLSYTQITDGLMEQVASSGEKLRYLNLSNTKITSHALSVLVGCTPNLDTLSLSHTLVDDTCFMHMSMTPSLRVIDLSHTRIRGFVYSHRESSDKLLSLGALQNLTNLRSLNLEDTKVMDEALQPLSLLTELECLYLKCEFLTEISLHVIASLQKLKFLGFRDAVLTEEGLLSFRPPPLLCVFDLRGCWLLLANTISSFCKKYQQVEVRHVYASNRFEDENVSYGSSASFRTTKVPLSRPRTVGSSNASFMDERMKYSTEDLLKLENSPGFSSILKDLDLLPESLRKM
ncbi:LRR receptor-like serine/threonine-protein kinase GSO2 [Phalaenopsis equestris]|uniref:LRR receptor-like serine/threonine-protein kinase GSO2 n=1 Tax=Phalaenopsis equestris TaxID=78828 RepID=UPI0009E51844|nr:LRR receptor-like serine/threonine-protein kinase GSO2 [Phalaenopsis equestris]